MATNTFDLLPYLVHRGAFTKVESVVGCTRETNKVFNFLYRA